VNISDFAYSPLNNPAESGVTEPEGIKIGSGRGPCKFGMGAGRDTITTS
jgi:hypothetical protein